MQSSPPVNKDQPNIPSNGSLGQRLDNMELAAKNSCIANPDQNYELIKSILDQFSEEAQDRILSKVCVSRE